MVNPSLCLHLISFSHCFCVPVCLPSLIFPYLSHNCHSPFIPSQENIFLESAHTALLTFSSSSFIRLLAPLFYSHCLLPLTSFALHLLSVLNLGPHQSMLAVYKCMRRSYCTCCACAIYEPGFLPSYAAKIMPAHNTKRKILIHEIK